jgi:thymidylate synthase (FAD)
MELIRHRVGTSISQESGRYVRLEDLTVYLPECFDRADRPENSEKFQFFCDKMEEFEKIQKELAEMFNISDVPNFSTKKELTSAFRRLAPEGICTTIGWGCNFRTLRNVIELRTSPHAEEEIRVLFGIVYDIVKDRYPNVFQDFETVDTNDGLRWIKKTA